MLFNSWQFALFLPIVFALYWLLPSKFRWILLLVASCYFYMSWDAKYIILILFTTAVSYFCARWMGKTEKPKRKKILLLSTLIACLGVLFVFKYFNFFSASITGLLSSLAIPVSSLTLKLVLPLGISFYTFKTLSYVIDVYRGKISAEPHFGYYATYVSFFPELLAGPIDRADLLTQIKAPHPFDYEKATYGLKQMAWGFFKKMVVADTLAIYVDTAFNSVGSYKGFALLLASVFYAIQIYCDFSGYSDIAIGTAKLFGIDLMENFKNPYFSASIKEFWSRWHISLSTWFRDYVYIPLGGNRCSTWRKRVNLMVTFLTSGLWHGANWTFLMWGGIHGLAQVVENRFTKNKKRSGDTQFSFKWLLRVCVVFLFCTFAWIFFRADSIGDAFYVISNMFSGITSPIAYFTTGSADLSISTFVFLKLALILSLLVIYDYLSLKRDVIRQISNQPTFLRWSLYLLIFLVVLLLRSHNKIEFIYSQF